MKGNRHSFAVQIKAEDAKKAVDKEIAFITELIEEIGNFSKHTDKHPKARIRNFFAKNRVKEVIKLKKKLDSLIFWAGVFSIYDPFSMVILNMHDVRLFNISGHNI